MNDQPASAAQRWILSPERKQRIIALFILALPLLTALAAAAPRMRF